MSDTILLEERAELFDNAIHFRANKRVPIVANIWSWKFLDNGYKLSEAIYDYDKNIKSMDDFHNRYHFDAYCDLGTRNAMRVADALGGGNHKIDDESDLVTIIQHDHKLMEEDEYGELTKDPFAFYWSKAMRRVCKDGITIKEIKNALQEFAQFGALIDTLTSNLMNKHHAMLLGKSESMLPFDMMFNNLRGITSLSLDVRKHKNELKEALDAIYALEIEPMLDEMLTVDYTGYITPIMIGFLGHSILSTKQFEMFYWPYLKKIIDKAIEYKKPLYFIFESSVERFSEFFQDAPKGTIIIHPELDDLVDLRNKMPNVTLAGGMRAAILGYATTHECIDEAKQLIDTLGDGFILSQDKMISFRNDAKRENILAVNEFVKNYHY